jgi:hypothetical protein
MTRKELISQIERCSRETGLRPSTICRLAIGNSKTFQALVDNKPGPGIDAINQLSSWIDERLAQDSAA